MLPLRRGHAVPPDADRSDRDNLDVDNERPEVRLRPLARREFDLVHHWLIDPEVRRWWGDAASAMAEIRLALESPTAICRLIEPAGSASPIGYAQAIELGLESGKLPNGLEPGTWDCDLFIASQEYRGRGFGQAALAHLVDEVFSSTLAIACAISVSIRNERAARAYEKIGFRWASITDDPILGPSWVMRRNRGPA